MHCIKYLKSRTQCCIAQVDSSRRIPPCRGGPAQSSSCNSDALREGKCLRARGRAPIAVTVLVVSPPQREGMRSSSHTHNSKRQNEDADAAARVKCKRKNPQVVSEESGAVIPKIILGKETKSGGGE